MTMNALIFLSGYLLLILAALFFCAAEQLRANQWSRRDLCGRCHRPLAPGQLTTLCPRCLKFSILNH